MKPYFLDVLYVYKEWGYCDVLTKSIAASGGTEIVGLARERREGKKIQTMQIQGSYQNDLPTGKKKALTMFASSYATVPSL
jgi:hypothetical protein